MSAWPALLGEKRTDEQTAAMRAKAAQAFEIEKFSCDDCGAKNVCGWAFDAYNTDGDCLAEK